MAFSNCLQMLTGQKQSYYNLREGTCLYIIFLQAFSLSGARAVFVGQAFQPACPEMPIMAGWKACPTLYDPVAPAFHSSRN